MHDGLKRRISTTPKDPQTTSEKCSQMIPLIHGDACGRKTVKQKAGVKLKQYLTFDDILFGDHVVIVYRMG